jgi:MFS family permease
MALSQKKMLAGGIGILLIAQCLYGIFTLAALYKTYRNTLLSVRSVATEKLGLDLSRQMRFGKNLERMEGLDLWLQRLHQTTEIDTFIIRNAAGKDIAAWPKGSEAPALPEKKSELQVIRNDVKEFSDKSMLWLTQPIYNRTGELVGTVLTGIDEQALTKKIIAMASAQGGFFGGISLLACALFFIFILREGKFPFFIRGKWCFILPLIISQVLFLAYLRMPVGSFLHEKAHEAAMQLGQEIGQDIKHILHLGLPLSAVPSVQAHLDGIRKTLPWVQTIAVRTPNSAYTSGAADSAIIATIPLHNNTEQHIADITVGVADSFVGTASNEIIFNALTTMVIALLCMLELVSLQSMHNKKSQETASQGAQTQLSPLLVRPLLFLCMFAIDLPISFIPLRIAAMDLTFLGLSPDVVMGLPLSVEMCTVGLGILAGGMWSQKYGWRPLFLWGAVLVTLGNIASGLGTTPLSYILARGFSGFGYGFINIAGQIFVIAHSTQENRAGSFSAMVAGIYAGFLCGSAFGSLIADTIGYAYAFFASSLCMAAIGIFILCLPREPWIAEKKQNQKLSYTVLGKLLADKRMLGLLLGNIFPCAFITVCLFQFFIPVSLHSEGVSPAGIGRVFLLFCLVIIALGPRIGKVVDASHNKSRWLLAGSLLAIGGIGALILFKGIIAAFLAVAMLALCNAIVSSAQGAYALELPIAHNVGSANTVSCYNITERIGQMLGPVTLGQAIALWGVHSGLVGMAVICILLTLFFALMRYSAKGTVCR